MATKQIPLVETLDYAANMTRTLALERVGLITDLLLRLRMQYDTGTSPSPKEDALARIIKGMAIRDGQGHTWFACGDGRQLYWWGQLLYQGQMRLDELSKTAGQTNLIAEAFFRIHFGINPLNIFDPTAGIPAVELGQLSLEVTWGDKGDLGTDYTIDSAYIEVTPATILADQYEKIRDEVLKPDIRWEKYDIDAVIGELGIRRELPVGVLLRNSLVIVLNSADNRSDADVSEIGYYKALENVIQYRQKWETLRGYTQSRYGLPSTPTGVAMVQWSQIAADAALDLRARLPGYDYLCFSSAVTGGDIYIMHIAYTK